MTADISTSADDLIDLKGMLPEELTDFVVNSGERPFRARQLLSWLYEKDVSDLAAMTDLPQSWRTALTAKARVTRLQELTRRESAIDGTVKFLFGIAGTSSVESVLIVEGKRRTACLSSQVGCPLDCAFCATGKMGFKGRNLTAGEILDQLLRLNAWSGRWQERVTNVVMMGMGEPLLNYDNLTQALRMMGLDGLGIGGRRITVSTAGYVPGIERLSMEEDLNVGLAISLNATTDDQRSRIMPINRKFPIAQLMGAARDYFERCGRRVTFEYVLMAQVTDSDADARRLAALTRDIPCKINLIPYNELAPHEAAATGGEVFRRPSSERIDSFRLLLEECAPRRTVTLRESRGRDIDAACGQLYRTPESTPRDAPVYEAVSSASSPSSEESG